MDEPDRLDELWSSPGVALLDREPEIDIVDEVDESEPEEGAHERFRFDDYEWTAAGFKPNYRVIRMGDPNSPHKRRRSRWSGVFFSVMDKIRSALPGTGDVPWYPLVEYVRDKHGEPTNTIKRVTAHRSVGSPKDQVLYLSRVITMAKRGDVIDHRGEGPLDNRDKALQKGTYSRNNLTARPRAITRRRDLPPGVDWTNPSHKRVVGVVQVDGERIRSPETWPYDERAKAHAWYLAERAAQIKKLGLSDSWKNWEGKVPPLVFPPRKKRIYVVKYPVDLADAEIPF